MRTVQRVIELLQTIPAIDVVRRVAAQGLSRVYLTGPALRDLFLGLTPGTFAFITPGDPNELAQKIAQLAPGEVKQDISPIQSIAYYDGELGKLEFSDSKGLSLSDFHWRYSDFTVNMLSFNLQSNRFIDKHGSLNDIQSQTIRVLSDASFTSQPELLLRAVRLSLLTPDSCLAPQTHLGIKAYNNLLTQATAHSVGFELYLILRATEYLRGIQLLLEMGLLPHLIAYFLPFAVLDDHNPSTITAFVSHLCRLYRMLDDLIAPVYEHLQDDLPLMRQVLLLTPRLLHDLLKTAPAERIACLITEGELLEKVLRRLSAGLATGRNVYPFRARIVAIGYLSGLTSLLDRNAELRQVMDEVIRIFGPGKGLFSAILICAAWLARESEQSAYTHSLKTARKLLRSRAVRLRHIQVRRQGA